MRRWFLLLSLALEAGTVAVLFLEIELQTAIALYVLSHTLTSALLALAVWRALPGRYQNPKPSSLAFLFSFGFFVPVIGMLGFASGVLFALYLPREELRRPYVSIEQPRWLSNEQESFSQYGEGGVSALLRNRRLSDESRLKALMAVDAMPAVSRAALLQKTMQEPVDDLRLVAYRLLEARETRITEQIGDCCRHLDAARSDGERLTHFQRLACLHWEIAYQGLAQGELLGHTLRECRRYIDTALALDPRNASLHALSARWHLRQGEIDTAEAAFAQAMEAGYARDRLLPWLAEIRYLRRDFEGVRRIFAQVLNPERGAISDSAALFWCSR